MQVGPKTEDLRSERNVKISGLGPTFIFLRVADDALKAETALFGSECDFS